MAAPLCTPTRFVGLPAARARFGEGVDRLAPFLLAGDALADDVVEALSSATREDREALIDRALRDGIGAVPDAPEALRRLFAHLDHVPFWVDFDRVDRGGEAFLSVSWFGGLVLGSCSLVLGYCSPAGNKPLAFSGRLVEGAPRRLAETGRFVQAACLPGGLRRHGDGFAAMVRVRLVHAQVRHFLRSSPRWDTAAWGTPINQLDMAGTVLLFSAVLIDRLRRLGIDMLAGESEALMHLWRYAGYLLGVDSELLFATDAEGLRYMDLLAATQAPPDDDSRALTHALLDAPLVGAKTAEAQARARRIIEFGHAASRFLIGDEYADHLRLAQTPWRHAFVAAPRLVHAIDRTVRSLPIGARLQRAAGMRYWRNIVELGLAGLPATFAMPERLSGLASR